MKTFSLYQLLGVTHARRPSPALRTLTRSARRVNVARLSRRSIALALFVALIIAPLPGRGPHTHRAQAQTTVRVCSPNSEYIIQNCALGGSHEEALENEAINDLLTAHMLPVSALNSENRYRLLDWQRNEIRAAMFDKLLAYIKKDPAARSAHEQTLVDGLANLVKQRRVLAASKAIEEYNRWANSPCTYVAPAGFRYNIPTTCATPGGGGFGGHRPPKFEEFQNYGVSIAYADFQNKPELQAIAGDTARSLGLLGGFAAAGVAGVIGGAIGASLTAGSAIITAIQPFVAASIGAQTATGVIGAVSIGAAAAIVILAVVLGIFQGINVFEDAQIPGQLQEAKTNAENTTPDLAQLIMTDAGLREVFAEFLQATMPDFPATTGVPAQQDSDPKFLLTPGGTVDPLLKYKDWTGVNHTARLNGGWFVDQAAGGQERLTLSIDYVDAAGVKWTASRVGGEFLHTRTDAPDASFKSAEITYQDWSGAVLTARIYNAAPSIAALTLTRKQGPPAADGFFGSNPNISQVATINDAEDAEDSLTVDVLGDLAGNNPVNGVTVSDVKVDANGKVTAKVQPSCGASDAGFILRVTDSTGQSAYAILHVMITPNSAPVLSYPAATQRVAAGGALTVDPTSGPSDEGRGINDVPLLGDPILGDATVSPGFTGTVQVVKYPLQNGFPRLPAGRVTINNAGPAGTYTVMVPLTGDCNGITNATFTLVVERAPSISAASVTRQQGAPASISTIATVGDDQTSAGNLVVTATSVPAGISVTDLTNSGGNVTAKVAAACGVSPGAKIVGLKVTNGAGLSSTASLIVNVTPDQQPPVITLNGANPMTVEYYTNFTDPGASAADNCAGSVPVSASGSVNASVLGSYTITYTASDGRNTATRTRTVNVVDTTPPTIGCPAAQTAVIAGTSGAVNYPAPLVSDNRAGATYACTPASGANFALGVTTVNCQASDHAGNKSPTCGFTITVRQPRPAIKDLITKVKTLVPPLTQAQANQLIGHLEMASTNLERGQSSQACTYLQNFSSQVNALVSRGPLSTAQGQALIDYANKIKAAAGGG